jgi:adenylate cyclase
VTVPPFVERLAFIGVSPSDPDDIRVQKVSLTVPTVTVTILSTIWVVTYLALGLPQAAAIPFTYQVIAVASLALFARTRNLPFFRTTQLVVILALPFLLQWVVGGYVASSAVSLWALVGAFGALFFFPVGQAIPWFLVFVVLTVISGYLEPVAAEHAADIPASIRQFFFVINVLGVSITAYLLLQYAVRARDAAMGRSERLLLNILPKPIADRLKVESGVIAESRSAVTVLFADVVDFTPFTERTEPERVVAVLDEIFSAFDELADRLGLEKIKTVGDAYMVVAGLPDPRPDHAMAGAEMALAMLEALRRVSDRLGVALSIRIGMASGPVIAGVIGRRKFIYDLWGDTVNTASRMESSGIPGRIQVTPAVVDALRDDYAFEDRGEIEVKGKGLMRTFLLVGRSG